MLECADLSRRDRNLPVASVRFGAG